MLSISASVRLPLQPNILLRGWRQIYDADGHLAGIEILDAVKRLGDKDVFKQIILEDIALGRP